MLHYQIVKWKIDICIENMSLSNLFFREILKMFQRARIQFFYLGGQVALYFISFYPTPSIPSHPIPSPLILFIYFTHRLLFKENLKQKHGMRNIKSWVELVELVDGETEGWSGEGVPGIRLFLIFT